MTPPIYKRTNSKQDFLKTGVPKSLVLINVFLAVSYFLALNLLFEKGNLIIFYILLAGEIFHLWQLFTYLFTIWDTEYQPVKDENLHPTIDIFVTVCGEPTEIVKKTILSLKNLDYDKSKYGIYILNDGYVANKENWKGIEFLAQEMSVKCITRKVPGGAKAGNINNAIRLTKSSLVAIFDADHIPHADFLKKTVPYFVDSKMGFVQSPQYYRNFFLNAVTSGAFEQQTLFFGAICKGKNRLNSVTMCGTNMLISRKALVEVGNICEDSIAEDFITGLRIHERGWKSYYVAEVLAEGLAPEDFLSYYKQQFRWARGSLDVLFRSNLLFRRGLTLTQRIQYLSSLSYFLSGLVVLMNALIPIVFFFTGIMPLQISTMALAAIFLPYILVTLYVLQLSTNYSYSFRSLAFSMAGFNIHISAIIASIFGTDNSFSVTSKKKINGNFIHLVIPQIVYVILVLVGMIFAISREGMSPSVLSNLAWAILNTVVFSAFILVALPQKASVRKRALNFATTRIS